MYDYSYLVGALFWTGAWIAAWVFLPRQRRAMLWTGLLLAPAGPISAYWSLQDYWNPPYALQLTLGSWRIGLEDGLLSFALTGICAAALERVAGVLGMRPVRPGWRAAARALGWLSLGLAILLACIYALRMPSMNAILLMAAATATLMLARTPSLLALAAGMAAVFAAVYWLSYVAFFLPLYPGAFAAVWKLDRMWGVALAGVPLEEILWAGVTMLVAGPLLRACSGQATKLNAGNAVAP